MGLTAATCLTKDPETSTSTGAVNMAAVEASDLPRVATSQDPVRRCPLPCMAATACPCIRGCPRLSLRAALCSHHVSTARPHTTRPCSPSSLASRTLRLSLVANRTCPASPRTSSSRDQASPSTKVVPLTLSCPTRRCSLPLARAVTYLSTNNRVICLPKVNLPLVRLPVNNPTFTVC